MKSLRVPELMGHRVISVTPKTPVLRAAAVRILHKARGLLGVEDGAMGMGVGIVSQGDVPMAVFEKDFLT